MHIENAKFRCDVSDVVNSRLGYSTSEHDLTLVFFFSFPVGRPMPTYQSVNEDLRNPMEWACEVVTLVSVYLSCFRRDL